MEIAAIVGDVQAPYHDAAAFECCVQVIEDLKPDILLVNGDFPDWRLLSKRYPARSERPDLKMTMREEVAIQRALLRELVFRSRAKKLKYNQGNHEWRLYRTISESPQTLKLLELENITREVCVDGVLGLSELGFKLSGEYPNGCWLFDRNDKNKDVWVEHGFGSRKKAGHMAMALIDDRQASVVVGHGERLAGPNWKKVVGNRRFFGIEGGNLSILGEAGKAEGIYSTVPHTAPDMLNHQQGFVVIYRDGDTMWPFTIPIFEGKTFFGGKKYDGHNIRMDSLGAVAAVTERQFHSRKQSKKQRKSPLSRRSRHF